MHTMLSLIQNGLSGIALAALLVSLARVRKLEKQLAAERGRHILPVLDLELTIEPENEKGFYLRNDSLFLAKDIEFAPATVSIDDFGFTKDFPLRLYCPSFLRPQERVKIDSRIMDSGVEMTGKQKETFLPHLFFARFPLSVRFRNIENVLFEQTFTREKERFLIEKTERIP